MRIKFSQLSFTPIIIVVFVNFSCRAQSSDELPLVCPTIVTRDDWGGNTPTGVDYIPIPVQYVIVHHTVSQTCTTQSECSQFVLNIQAYHQNNLEYWDIGYNFLFGNDGNVYEGTGWHRAGAHTIGYNNKSLGIAFLGDFSNELPSKKALRVAKQFLQCGVELGELDENYKLYGARQVSSTLSPGLSLYQEIKNWPNYKRIVD